jgi:EamA domain-containing membrane protein RarD
MRKFKAVLLANAGVLELIKNAVEIIAFLIAATWAIYNFQLKEAPILETSARSFCELQIDSMSAKKCMLKFVLHLKNQGITSFDVDSVRISY